MSDLDLHTTIYVEMKPDVYAGKKCDEVRSQFQCQCEGDMDAETLDTITLEAKSFPPGTIILVQEPCCPKCTQVPEMCKADECCDFDWDNWCEEQYS